MAEKENVLLKIKEVGIVAVIRGKNSEEAMKTVDKCVENGLLNIELTFTVPYAHRLIEDLSRRYSGSILLGAGSVLDSETARIALLSGAEFVVSPYFNPEIIRLCNRYRKVCMAGIMTVNEAVRAMESGTDILKLFPGELYGPSFIKAIRGPLPYAQIMPTGGVDIGNIGDWFEAGAVAVGIGSNLTKGDISKNISEFLKAAKKARDENKI